MPTECSAESFDFGTVEGRCVEAAFDAGLVTSDTGALLLGATDRAIRIELDQVAAKSARTGRPQRRFKAFMWRTRKSWSRRRRVVTKAEWTKGEANPRFIVTSLRGDQGPQLSPQECANYFTHFNMSGIRFSNVSRSSERLKYTQMPPLSPYTLLISS
jgi:hypothetical protein